MHDASASDLMTREPVTVPPDMPVAAIARLMAMRGITALPVVDAAGALLGLVTAADLTHRLVAAEPGRGTWLRWLPTDAAKEAEHYARAHGFVAEEVMQTALDTVPPAMPAGEIAALLERRNIRRVLVTEAGRLLGVVSRSDLLRAVPDAAPDRTWRPDGAIRADVLAAMRREAWADRFPTAVEVHDGIVEFHGFPPGPAILRGLRVLAEHVAGVKGVRDRTDAALPFDPVLL